MLLLDVDIDTESPAFVFKRHSNPKSQTFVHLFFLVSLNHMHVKFTNPRNIPTWRKITTGEREMKKKQCY